MACGRKTERAHKTRGQHADSTQRGSWSTFTKLYVIYIYKIYLLILNIILWQQYYGHWEKANDVIFTIHISFWIYCCFTFLSFQTLKDVCSLLPRTHIPTLVVSSVSLMVLIAAKELNSFLGPKLPVPIPVELITVSWHEDTLWPLLMLSPLYTALMLMLQR